MTKPLRKAIMKRSQLQNEYFKERTAVTEPHALFIRNAFFSTQRCLTFS